MKEIKLLIRENISCWYELSFRKTKPAIVLRVHNDFIKGTAPVSDDAPIIVDLKKPLGFKNFVGNFDGNFGFDNVFVRREGQGEKKDFVEFVAEIPRVKIYTGVACQHCNGSGKGDFSNKCSWCGGKGEEYEYDWRMADAISASFTVFSSLLRFPEVETSSSLIQLMIVETITVKDMHGGSLWGEFSIPLCSWLYSLEQNDQTDFPEISESMQAVHRKLYGELDPYAKYNFRAYVHGNGRFTLDCPGDACGIYNSPDRIRQIDEGREFHCHNVDQMGQQLTLLSGLAALHDKARREIKI